MPAWDIGSKVYDPIENKTIQVEFIDTMIAEHPLFENYYDPANIKIDGGRGTYYGEQASEDGPKRWKRGFSRADWPYSETFKQELEMVEYGLFGDMTSHDFGRLAFEDPAMLGRVYDAKIEGVFQQWKRATETHILYNVCNKENYATASIEEFDNDYFKISSDPQETLKNQAKALDIIAKIENKLYEALDYSKKYNQAGKEVVTKSLKNFTIILHPMVNTFLSVYGYSTSFNVGYLELRNKVGKVIIKKLPDWKKDDVIYRYVNTKTGDKVEIKAEENKHVAKWRILAHDNNFYKIRDAINHPGNNDVFLDSKDYNIDLTSYIGKWWFALEGVIKFVNAFAWLEKSA